jgi:hypothetical protein
MEASVAASASASEAEPQKKKRVRKTSFKLRNPTLKKKAMELSELCDIPVCVISFDKDNDKPHTWPEAPQDLLPIIHKYKNYHGIHKKFSLANQKKGCKEIKEEDFDCQEEKHKKIDGVEEFKKVLDTWKAWLNEQHDEESLESFWTIFDSMFCSMNERMELLRLKRNTNFEVGSSSGSGNSSNNRSTNTTIRDFDLNN